MNNKINVGLIGFGNGGQVFHAPIITSVEGFSLNKIRARKPDQVTLAYKRYPKTKVVSAADGIINDKTIDLVIISTPNEFHVPFARRALEAGKHVVVDKPFTINTQDADELIALADKKKKILSVFQSRRFDSDFKTVDKIISSGLLGKVAELESRYDRFRNYLKPGAWREDNIPGSGILYDLGSHLIDQALTLFGLPNAITANIRIQRAGASVDDNFELTLDYENLKVSLKSGMLIREPLQRFVVLGNEGSFVKKGLDVQEEALKKGLNPGEELKWGIEPQEIWGTINSTINGIHIRGKVESEKGDYREYYKNIYEAIKLGTPLIVTPKQARNVIRIIELAIRSNWERRTIDYTDNY